MLSSWIRPWTQAFLCAGVALSAVWLLQAMKKRRHLEGDPDADIAGEEEDLPWALPEPPSAGPAEVPEPSDLDKGLMALGLLASSCSAPSAGPRRAGHGKRKEHPSIENEEVDETVEVRRVSPEEEERRYWASMAGGLDLFSGLDGAEAEEKEETSDEDEQEVSQRQKQRKRPISYEEEMF